MKFKAEERRESHSGSRKCDQLVDFKSEKVRDTEWRLSPKPYLPKPFKAYTSSAETHYLYELCRQAGPGNFAELGIMNGGNTTVMGHGISAESTLYAVDLFDLFWNCNKKLAMLVPEKLRTYWKEKNLPSEIKVIKDYIVEAGKKLRDLQFKFIFIDGDHSYENCKADAETWLPLLEIGGIVAFHDTNIEGVHQVVSALPQDQWEFQRQVFTIKTYKRIF